MSKVENSNPSSGQPVISVANVSRSFALARGFLKKDGAVTAVDDVSFQLRRGETFGLVGESGCGKSTLAKMLLGLLAPTAGEIRVNGRRIGEDGRLATARCMQPIFQDPYSSLNPRKTVSQIVSLPLDMHGVGTSTEREAEVRRVLDLVGMPRRTLGQFPGQLSGGQRQRVAIARALILKPEVLICDEPTSALDVSVQAQILNLLLDLKSQMGLTYLFISHNLAVVEHLADRVAVMYRGRVVECGSVEDVFVHPQHAYTKTLLDSDLSASLGTRAH
jgi:peptide/nickel transport system ATP-binding protein